MSGHRTETDTFGPIEVAADRYWGAQAQRSLGNFKIGWEKQPLSVVRLPGARFRVTAHEPITVRETENKAADVLAGIQAANRFVEERVREVPEDWFWVHKRWPDRVYAALEAAAPSAERRNGPQ